MKINLNEILKNAVVGKKIAKQSIINERYWGVTITDGYIIPDWRSNNEYVVYVLRTDCDGNNQVIIDFDSVIELE